MKPLTITHDDRGYSIIHTGLDARILSTRLKRDAARYLKYLAAGLSWEFTEMPTRENGAAEREETIRYIKLRDARRRLVSRELTQEELENL